MTTELPKQPIGAFDYETTISFGDFIASLVEIIKRYETWDEDEPPIVQDLDRLVHDHIRCLRTCDGQCPLGKECEL